MNKIADKSFLAGDKFMHELHLRQPVFTYGVCWPFTKQSESIGNFKETMSTRTN